MLRSRRVFGFAGLCVVLASSVVPLSGCNTGGGMPQQLEATKPRMDRERETDRPVEAPAPSK